MASHFPTTTRPTTGPTRWPRVVRTATLTLAAAASLAACGGGAEPHSAATTPVAAPSVDDSSVSVVPPAGASSGATEAPPAARNTAPASTVPTRTPDTASPVAPAPATVADPGTTALSGVTAPAGTAARTVPGLADGAVALPSTVQVADDGRCHLSALQLQPVDLQGSPGGTYADFRIVNVSRTACAVRGYVTATLLGEAGNALPTTVRQEAGPNVWVKIAPSGAAQFHLRFPNPMSGPTPCNPPNAPRLRIGVPGTSGTLTGNSPEGGIQACNGNVSTAPLGST